MTTLSTISLLPANSPTTNVPLATTTNIPPVTSTTTNLPPATSTTSHLLLATSTTSYLPLATSSTSHLSSTSMARACNINEAYLFVVLVIGKENILIEVEIEELDVVTMNEDVESNVILELGCLACQIQEFKKEEGCKIVKVRDIRAGAYRTLYTEEGKEMAIQEKDKVVDYKVVRNPEDGSVECTSRHFLCYGFLCRHVFCVLKICNIEVILKRYILRRWRRDLIPPALRRNTNRYGEKDEAIEKLTNKANFVVDECLFLLRKDEEQLKQFVEKLENIKKEIQVKVPKPPSQKMGDVIEDIYAIKKLKQKLTNKHTKTTCPLNPKYIAKLERIEAVAEQERRTAASATEQEEINSDTTHIADKEQSNTAC
nr:zinc finger, SWIM-type [Tanacetum cinerariifolium]